MSPEITIAIATTPQQREDAFAVRIAVFVVEQQIPREIELDEYDDVAVHCVAYDGSAPVGAGRLVVMQDVDGTPYAKIGRMAVLATMRGRSIGARLLEALEREGAARTISVFKLSAQLTARGFYDRAGYVAVGDVYDEADLPHIAMQRRVQK